MSYNDQVISLPVTRLAHSLALHVDSAPFDFQYDRFKSDSDVMVTLGSRKPVQERVLLVQRDFFGPFLFDLIP